MITSLIRKLALGSPIETAHRLQHRLPNYLALPVFASDALSSVAYGTEEVLIVLTTAGFAALSLSLPITLAIGALMLIVTMSYRQSIQYYPGGGGSYSVANDNLGVGSGLVAAAALTIDYILTVAVSVSAGIAALASAFTFLFPHRVELALLVILIITLANLRGVKESSYLFAIPTYTFILIMSILIVTCLYHIITGTIPPVRSYPIEASPGMSIGLFLILRAFSNGCSALTGVEAISNGVTAFQPPETRNASKTLAAMGGILIFLFVGIGLAAYHYHVIPYEKDIVTSQLARANFGNGILYIVSQLATLAILCVAANTSYAGFPRLASMVAQNGYAPKLFANLGDRLVYNWGICFLAVVSSSLIIHFQATTNRLIPLYAIGVFLCFTLSQTGMMKKMMQIREKGWLKRTSINGLGALTTGTVTAVVLISKFMEGAWMVVVLVVLIIGLLLLVRKHYDWFDKRMQMDENEDNPLSHPMPPLTILVLISSDIHRGILEGLAAGKILAMEHSDSILRAVHIEMDPEKTKRLQAKWEKFVEPYEGSSIRLDIVPSPYRLLVEPLMQYLDTVEKERLNDRVVVVLPEFDTGSLITKFLHNFTGFRLRNALLNRRNVFVLYDRFFMK